MKHTIFLALTLAGALALAACSNDGGGADSLRATAQAAGVSVPAEPPTAQPTEQPAQVAPTPFPTSPARVVEVPPSEVDVQQVEVTRIVEVTQPAQVIEVPVIVTATPDIAGFQNSGIDEGVQPCPIRFWKRGRCTATQAQIEQASEVQP